MLYINNFLKYSICIGHSYINSLFLSSWFFYKLKNKIWIINIFKTILFLKLSLKFLRHLVTNRFPFWFINMEFDKEFIFKKKALECGEFACTRYWVRGLLSNFKSIQNSISNYIFKKDVLKSNIKKGLVNTWPITRFTWPRGAFLSNIPLNYVVCKEAGTINLPVIAMVDTNIKSYLFSFPIPANDDALDSVCYIINIVAKQLLLFKYKNVLLWYHKYKIKNTKVLKILKHTRLIFRRYRSKHSLTRMLKVKYLNNKGSFYSSLLNKQKWSNLTTFFNGFLKFKNNMKELHKINNNNNNNNNNIKQKKRKGIILNNKLKFLRKLCNKYYFFANFFQRYDYELTIHPKGVLSNTVALKYLNTFKNKNQMNRNSTKFYFTFFALMFMVKYVRTFYETFFINEPTPYTFVRRCHIPDPNKDSDGGYWKNKNDPGKWYTSYGYKYKIDTEGTMRWQNNKFNMRLKQNKNRNATTYLNDTAIVVNLDRWLSPSKRPTMFKKLRRKSLHFWLIPFFKKFSIKDGYKRYQSIFYNKEDVKYKRGFNWNHPAKTPFSALHYYSNWFFFLARPYKKNQIGGFRRRLRKLESYVF